jgi:hypothetical protein
MIEKPDLLENDEDKKRLYIVQHGGSTETPVNEKLKDILLEKYNINIYPRKENRRNVFKHNKNLKGQEND